MLEGFPLGGGAAEMDVSKLSAALCVMTETVERYGGMTDVLLCDDKGFVFKAVWGVIEGHEQAEERGVLAALSIFERLSSIDVRARAGISSGVPMELVHMSVGHCSPTC